MRRAPRVPSKPFKTLAGFLPRARSRVRIPFFFLFSSGPNMARTQPFDTKVYRVHSDRLALKKTPG
jgi:hypothetical protein